MDQVKQRIVATYHLKAIEEDEIKQYILFRLAKAGWKSNPEFEEDIFSEIYRYTKGIPRRINTLCDRLLLFGYLEERSVIDLESTRHVISEIEADYDSLNIEKETAIEKIESTDDLTKNQRIIALEQKVADLSNSLHKEKILLRKAILIHLDMDDAYPED
jgi:Holliday junction resolvasome RuvABC ATP-dependent DNA helicase subunit